MAAPAPSAVPHLGEMSATFAVLFGAPLRVESHGAGVIRWYLHGGASFTVLFDRNRAIAVQFPHHARELRRRDLRRMVDAVSGEQSGHVYIDDASVIVAEAHCPRSAIDLLAALARPAHGGNATVRTLRPFDA
jgi:hypothetical protein